MSDWERVPLPSDTKSKVANDEGLERVYPGMDENASQREPEDTSNLSLKQMGKNALGGLAAFGQLGAEVFFQLFNEMTKQNITGNLERMNIPSLVMGGFKDNVIPNHIQRTLASLLPKSETYFLKDGSHVPQADYPDMINERIELFVEQHFSQS